MKTNKDKFMDYADLRLREKKYKAKLLKSNIKDIQIKGMEKTARRKVGQF
ncbi:hypothetical protein [Clostridium botulinum]|nr:hypothetical protein [Clostridium botulinum]APC85209.1 hypothetical protein NPD12_1475 [Clostridium botulinum]EDT82828.1 hypothetical protein CBN_1363 [Clostridium botulinum NCTC 2916]MBY6770505.1 hypothetical protein [Clostridium botulinum]MBY6777262.1 hypothetical protein [Clostridium botulinum]MBY6781624.1 hypothetical protein [Clostridium botulinum]